MVLGDTPLCLGKVEMCEFATVPVPLMSLSSPLLGASGFLRMLQRGPGSRWKEQGGRTQIHRLCQGSPVPALLFPEDKQAV